MVRPLSDNEMTTERLERSKAKFGKTDAHTLRCTVHQWMGKFELTVVNPEGVGLPMLAALDALAIAHGYEEKAAELDALFQNVLAAPGGFDDEKTWTPSCALVAKGVRGVVLEHRGGVEDLRLGEAPQGLSIWEGDYRPIHDGEGAENEAMGTFRPLTDAEWEKVRRGESLWGDER